jgi:DNA-3-methyladenine glycosylase II
MSSTPPATIDVDAAVTHLLASEPVMASIVAAVGPCTLRAPDINPFRALARAIVFQQLSGKAASTIFGRFAALVPGGVTDPASEHFPLPSDVLALDEVALRGAGLSRQKATALRDLAAHFASGELETHNLHRWDDGEVIAHLTRVRGIGRWTAEMFLMFELRRADILPVDDLGIRRAAMRRYGLGALPGADDLRRLGEPWRPWSTVASWYLWRSEDVVLLE